MKLNIHAELVGITDQASGGYDPAGQLDQLLAAIGFIRSASVVEAKPLPMPVPSVSSTSSAVEPVAAPASVMDEPSVQDHIAKRERGKPSAGRKRRTAEEVAEDEAAEKTAAETVGIVAMKNLPDDATSAEVAEAFAGVVKEGAAISTGEARVGPEDESEEDQIQDIADEHAEIAATVEPGAPATLEDVRAALMGYGHAYGMPAVQADGQAFMRSVLGEPPEGQPIWKMTMFPEDRYGEIVSAFKVATETNPNGRARV